MDRIHTNISFFNHFFIIALGSRFKSNSGNYLFYAGFCLLGKQLFNKRVVAANYCLMLVDWRNSYVSGAKFYTTTGTISYVCLRFTFSNYTGNIFHTGKKLNGQRR